MEIILKCPCCGKELGNVTLFLYSKFTKGVHANRTRKLFCDKVCYEKYIKQFEVEVYKDRPIYYIPSPEGMLYIPYWECYYGFKTIEDCKARMNSKTAVLFK